MDQPDIPDGRDDRPPDPTVVDLRLLSGPEHGMVKLPQYMDWSGHHQYNLDVDEQMRDLYETVLNEASRPEDLRRYLNAKLLVRAWPRLRMPARVRQAWESRCPELAGAAG